MMQKTEDLDEHLLKTVQLKVKKLYTQNCKKIIITDLTREYSHLFGPKEVNKHFSPIG